MTKRTDCYILRAIIRWLQNHLVNDRAIVILIYYFLATILPVDKIIGKIYPVFGIVLIVMALGIGAGILFYAFQGKMTIPEFSWKNVHPADLPRWPLLFITIACGAISGFHATQSPLMARCLKTEKDAHKVFYGAMVGEGIIALIWAVAGMAYYYGNGGIKGLQVALNGYYVFILEQKEFLYSFSACNFYECSFYDVYSYCTRRISIVDKNSLSNSNSICSSLSYNIYCSYFIKKARRQNVPVPRGVHA